MWEIFSGGRNPYPAVDPMTLAQLLTDGRRLDVTNNAACTPEMYVLNYRFGHFSLVEQ